MSRHGFSCEHCGRHEGRHDERFCNWCHDGMCIECTDEHDDEGHCPKDTLVVYARELLVADILPENAPRGEEVKK